MAQSRPYPRTSEDAVLQPYLLRSSPRPPLHPTSLSYLSAAPPSFGMLIAWKSWPEEQNSAALAVASGWLQLSPGCCCSKARGGFAAEPGAFGIPPTATALLAPEGWVFHPYKHDGHHLGICSPSIPVPHKSEGSFGGCWLGIGLGSLSDFYELLWWKPNFFPV